MHRRHAIATIALAALAAAPGALFAQAAPAKSRVVVQVSDADPAKWNLALNNVRNLQKDLGADKVDIEVVAYGPGIGMLKADSAVASRIDETLQSGVHVVACENTMAGQKLTKPDMLPRIGYVPSGVVELTQKQHAGWAYLRP